METSRIWCDEFYDFAPVGTLAINENGLIHEVNVAAASMLGIEKRLLVDKSFSRFIDNNGQDTFDVCRRAERELSLSNEKS